VPTLLYSPLVYALADYCRNRYYNLMSSEGQELPFKNLGDRLKTIRQKLQESVAEVSGAVEIDEATLRSIEQGNERPSEDILMLLISHFGMQDDEAANLWQLAGYDRSHRITEEEDAPGGTRSSTATILVMAVDPRVLYSDGVSISASKHGVIFNFSQGTGTQHMLTTAKIGMSREQAHSVLQTLQQALQKSEPRQLGEGQKSESKKEDER
jgi:transcriptional regulator with XRE-family HTH domain